jgi:hypothetical protein
MLGIVAMPLLLLLVVVVVMVVVLLLMVMLHTCCCCCVTHGTQTHVTPAAPTGKQSQLSYVPQPNP